MTNVFLPETNKRSGVHYAVTSDGVELPIVDVTHPAFSLNITDTEQQARTKKFLESKTPFSVFPKFIRTRLLQFFLRGSVLAEGIQQSQGSFMTGMHTYLLKLGPEMLGKAYAKPVDRHIAASLPVLSARLRLQDMAYLMAEILLPTLSSDPQRPLCFINIAGGPAMDSLNAMILLNQRHPGVLSDREVFLDVLDRDEEGPKFGEAALSALSSAEGPLRGARVVFRHVAYDWSRPEDLQPRLRIAHEAGALVVASSEGGLFEYGSDEDIEGNLRVLRASPDVVAVAGSVTRSDEPIQRLRETSTAATIPRGLAVFGKLAESAGWRISEKVERPFSDQVVLI